MVLTVEHVYVPVSSFLAPGKSILLLEAGK
jgi:hypothetical protein